VNWPAVVSVAVALPGLAAYSAFLGGVLLALQAHDAGLPWSVVVQTRGEVTLIIDGLQVVALALVTSAVIAAAGLAWMHFDGATQAAKWRVRPQRALGGARRAASVAIRGLVIVVAALVVAALAAAASLALLDGLGLVLPFSARIGLLAVFAIVGIWRSSPFERTLRQRPVIFLLFGVSVVLALGVYPIPWVVFFLTIGAVGLVSHKWDSHEIRRRWSPYLVAGGYLLVVGVAYAFAVAAIEPLGLERVVLASPERVAFGERVSNQHELRTAGLVSLGGSDAMLAACLIDEGTGREAPDRGYSGSSVLFKAAAEDLASLVGGDRLMSDSAPPRDHICR
jgi:hypothetical protein